MTTTAPGRPALRALKAPLPDRHSPFRSEFLRGLAPWTGATVTAVLLAAMLSKSVQWQGSWGGTQSLLKSAAVLLGGPLAVAAGCWQGGRERRRGTVGLLATASRGRPAKTLVAVAPLTAWVLIGYLVALVVVLAATLPYAHRGRPLVSYAVTDLTFLVSITAVGFVAGRLVPWRLTAPLLAVCAYLGLGFPAYLGSDLRLLSPAEQVDTTYVPLWWQPLVMSAWTGGLAAAAFLVYAARRRAFAVLPLAMAVAAGTLIADLGPGMWRHVPTPGVRACGSGETGPTVCVDDPDRELLPAIRAALGGLHDRLQEMSTPPYTYVANNAELGPIDVRLPSLSRGWNVVRDEVVDPAAFARETAQMLPFFGRCSTEKLTPAEAERFSKLQQTVLAWLAPADTVLPGTPPHGSVRDTDLRAPLAAMAPAARASWLDRYVAAARSCDPKKMPKL